jgi:hypothetical protein
MISDGICRWPYLRITNQNCEFLCKVSREFIDFLKNRSSIWKNDIDDFFDDAETVKSFRFLKFLVKETFRPQNIVPQNPFKI